MPTAVVVALIACEGVCFSAFCTFLAQRHSTAYQELLALLTEMRRSRDDAHAQVDALTKTISSLKRTITRLTNVLRSHNIALDDADGSDADAVA